MKRVIIIAIILLSGSSYMKAQDTKPGKTQFMVRGYGHAGLNLNTADETNSSYIGGAFSPIFIFKQGNRFLFETELEFELENNELKIGLEYANLMYSINDYLMVRAGKFLLPFGTFMERLHPAWINRFSSKPLGFGHDGIAPSSGVGIELRGATQIGSATINYSIYSTNGPRLKDGSDEPEEAGMLSFENYTDNNNNKAFGGRIGYLPLSNSSMEIGASYYSGKAGDKGSQYEDVIASLWALDFSFVKQVSSLRGVLDIKAQYNQAFVSSAIYTDIDEGRDTTNSYTYNNLSSAYYTQLSYRPSMAENNILKNIEFSIRYSQLNTPKGSNWESDVKEISLGLNYWVSWRQVVKISYGTLTREGGPDLENGASGLKSQTLYLHWAIGL